jgi:hypothetical protein
VTVERATTREISWSTIIALLMVVAGVGALALLLRQHEHRAETERNFGCGLHSFGEASDSHEPSDCND